MRPPVPPQRPSPRLPIDAPFIRASSPPRLRRRSPRARRPDLPTADDPLPPTPRGRRNFRRIPPPRTRRSSARSFSATPRASAAGLVPVKTPPGLTPARLARKTPTPRRGARLAGIRTARRRRAICSGSRLTRAPSRRCTRRRSRRTLSPVGTRRPVRDGRGRLLARAAPRKIARSPFKVLDAPALQDDFYLEPGGLVVAQRARRLGWGRASTCGARARAA